MPGVPGERGVEADTSSPEDLYAQLEKFTEARQQPVNDVTLARLAFGRPSGLPAPPAWTIQAVGTTINSNFLSKNTDYSRIQEIG